MRSLHHSVNVVESPTCIRIVPSPPPPPPPDEREREWVGQPSALDRRPLADTVDFSACSRAREWLECQMRYQESHAPDEWQPNYEFHQLLSTAINDVRCALGGKYTPVAERCRSVAELLKRGPLPFRGLDLGTVKVPEGRVSELASQVDEWVQYYLDLGSEIATVVAFAILRHAEGIEHHKATTLQEYFDREDAETAAMNAAEDVESEFDYLN